MKYLIILILMFIYLNSYSQKIIEMEKKNGVYTIECKVNGIPMNFIFDTGASNVSISKTEASFLIKQGLITKNDIIGNINYKIANGKVLEGTKINIKEIEIKGIKVKNVTATVVHNLNAPLLLGQSFLSKLGTITLDGNKLIINNSKRLISNVEKNINEIETISSYSEIIGGFIFKYLTKIEYNKPLRTLTIKETKDFGNKLYSNTTTIYLDDIIKSNARYRIKKLDDEIYFVILELHTKHKSIECKNLEYKKDKEYFTVSEKKYLNRTGFDANGNNISKYLADKYIAAWKELLNLDDLIIIPDEEFKPKKNKTNIIPTLETIGIIKLGSKVKDYSFIIKTIKSNKKYKTNEQITRELSSHYVNLDLFKYETYANSEIKGIYIDCNKNGIIKKIIIDLTYNSKLLDELISKLGNPDPLNNGNHPDDLVFWSNDSTDMILITFNRNDKDRIYQKIVISRKK